MTASLGETEPVYVDWLIRYTDRLHRDGVKLPPIESVLREAFNGGVNAERTAHTTARALEAALSLGPETPLPTIDERLLP